MEKNVTMEDARLRIEVASRLAIRAESPKHRKLLWREASIGNVVESGPQSVG